MVFHDACEVYIQGVSKTMVTCMTSVSVGDKCSDVSASQYVKKLPFLVSFSATQGNCWLVKCNILQLLVKNNTFYIHIYIYNNFITVIVMIQSHNNSWEKSRYSIYLLIQLCWIRNFPCYLCIKTSEYML